MIDMVKAKIAFAEYTKKYDINNSKIRLKVEHIERVSQMSKKLATKLELSDEDIKLAELIGLLHDIGRFEQVKRYNTFVDRNSINHGKFGAEILFDSKNGIIRNFIEDNQYDQIIKIAIINHNKDARDISKDLNERELLHTKIIRDSDKIDILKILTYEKKEVAWEKADLSNDEITPEIYQEFMQKEAIDYSKKKSSADTLIGHFAYIFDFNFKESIEFVKKQNYMEDIYKRFKFNDKETMKMYNNAYKKVVEYMENKK